MHVNPVLRRTVAGLGVGALVAALFLYLPLMLLWPVVLGLAVLAQLEFYRMAKAYEPVVWFGLALGAAWIAAVAALGHVSAVQFLGVVALPVATFMASLLVLFSSRRARPIASVASTLFGFLYVPFLLSFMLGYAQIGLAKNCDLFAMPVSRVGMYTLFAVIVVTKLSDTGGFALGMACGRHKMCPSISPKKSWEGLAGSMLFSAAAAAGMLALARHFGWGETVLFWRTLTYPLAIAGGAVAALLATGGDLVESRFKRECGVKDSSSFLPAGMGGLLDEFDSALFVPALLYPLFLM